MRRRLMVGQSHILIESHVSLHVRGTSKCGLQDGLVTFVNQLGAIP